MRSCDFVKCHLNTYALTQRRKEKKNLRDLPTNQNHRPVLHVLQLADAGMFGLFAFHGSANDVEEFRALLDGPEVTSGRDDLSRDDHDDAEGDDGGELENNGVSIWSCAD